MFCRITSIYPLAFGVASSLEYLFITCSMARVGEGEVLISLVGYCAFVVYVWLFVYLYHYFFFLSWLQLESMLVSSVLYSLDLLLRLSCVFCLFTSGFLPLLYGYQGILIPF